MSIVPLKKVSLCGLLKEKPSILRELQNIGCMHLESLRQEPAEPEKQVPEHARDATKALRYLLETPRKRRQVRESSTFTVEQSVRNALDNIENTRVTANKRDFIARRLRDLEPWGDFTLPDDGALNGQLLWFYIIPHKDMHALYDSDMVWKVVHHNPRINYVVIIAPQEPAADALPTRRTRTGALSLSQLDQQREALEIELEKLHGEREALTRWISLLTSNLNSTEDQQARRHASTLTLDTSEGLFVVQGWVPAQRISELELLAEEKGLALLYSDPGPDDNPPTLMDNPPALESGEMLVNFYQTPAYRDWDPSRVVLFSFAAFFAMILADAGYALLLCIGLAAYWKKLDRTPMNKLMRSMLAFVFGASLVFGVMVGSYFGVTPPEGSFAASLKIMDLNDYNTMMTLSIVIGCLHVTLANALAAWHAHSKGQRNGHLAWIAVVVGGLFLWLGRTPDESMSALALLGSALLIGGIITLLLFTSERPVNRPKDAVLKLFDGLGNLTNLTRAFGDVLSYMRLFALGLASASMAMTFNQLAMSVLDALPGLGLLFAILILLFGHLVNLLLCIMSGVVHGLRLNVIEFFNWGLSNEGRPFHSYARKEAE
jgi:V/A-type H+-transporting ATPase subunit I